MKSGNEATTHLKLAERMTTPMEAVEGTSECHSCEHYMRLGEANLCTTISDEKTQIAEIIGWVPGRCGHYEKAGSPFETN